MGITSWLWDIQSGATLGVIWAIMALGLYMTYRVLNYADLTVDGSLTLGGAISAVYVAAGVQPILAILLATIGGMLAGAVTGVLHTKFKIPDLLAGILTQFGLYSINLRIMGKANFGLLNETTLFTQIKEMGISSKWAGLVVGLVFVVILIAVIYSFFGTEIGSTLRATGNNPDMVKAMGADTNAYIILGLVVGNGLVAMSGGLLAQYQGYADINMGVGTIVIGLAAVIIGEVVFGKLFRNFALKLAAVSIGAIIYYVVIQVVISLLDINSNYLKLISALIVAVFLAVPNLRGTILPKANKAGKEAPHAKN